MGYLLGYSIFGFTVYGVIMGLKNKGIFYNNKEDVFLSFSPVIILLVTLFLSKIFGEWFMYFGGIAACVSIVYIIYNSFVYNRLYLLSFSIGIAKIILSLLTVILFMLSVFNKAPDGRTSSGYRDTNSTWLTSVQSIFKCRIKS